MNTHFPTQSGCVPNIGAEEQRKRLLMARLAFCFALAGLIVLLAVGASREWRLVLFLPILAGATTYFQVRDKTCVALAVSGTRNLHGKTERMEDPHQLAQVRRQAVGVYLKGLVLALAIMAVLWVLPPG